MPEPVVTGAAGALAKTLGPPVARLANEWRKGSEAKRLVDSLKKAHPAAEKMLLQPDVLGHLWAYAETGQLDEDGLMQSLRAITSDDDEARELTEAVRTGTWRSVRDDRRVHFDLLRLQAEMRAERREEHSAMLERIESMTSVVAARLPVARQLPAEVDVFVDRETELAAAERTLAREGAGQGAVVLCCSGMAGTGKTTLALRIAHQYAEDFAGGSCTLCFAESISCRVRQVRWRLVSFATLAWLRRRSPQATTRSLRCCARSSFRSRF